MKKEEEGVPEELSRLVASGAFERCSQAQLMELVQSIAPKHAGGAEASVTDTPFATNFRETLGRVSHLNPSCCEYSAPNGKSNTRISVQYAQCC